MSEQGPPRSSRGNPAMGDIVRSVVVLGLIVLGLWVVGRVFFTETPKDPFTPVDYAAAAQSARQAAPYELLAPTSLPDGWRSNSARYTPGQRAEWHLGVLTDDDHYIGVEQGVYPVSDAVDRFAGGTQESGTTQIGGRTWTVRTGDGDTVLVSRDGDATTLVVGTASRAVIERYVATLEG